MAEKPDFDNHLRIEQAGARAGLNPMFGEWQRTFSLAPVPHGDGGAKRKAFQQAMQSELSNRWIYSHEVQLK